MGMTPEEQLDVLARFLARIDSIPFGEAYMRVLNSPHGEALYNLSIGQSLGHRKRHAKPKPLFALDGQKGLAELGRKVVAMTDYRRAVGQEP